MLLTYAQTGPDFEWEMILQAVEIMGAKCVIAHEKHKDGGDHYHALCVHPTKFQFRDHRAFDIGHYHPNIKQIKVTPEHTWAYVRKENDIKHDGIPEKPVATRKRKADTDGVFNYILGAQTKDQMAKRFKEKRPREYFTCHNNIKATIETEFPQDDHPAWVTPPNFISNIDLFPEILDWTSKYIDPIGHQRDTSCTPSLTTGSGSITSGESWDMDGRSSYELFEPGFFLQQPIDDQSIQGLQPEEGDKEDGVLLRCATPSIDRAPANITGKPRPISLIIWGPSRLCKTQWARSLGKHSYFSNEWNLAGYDDTCDYAIFDDMKGGMGSIDYKSWIGGQGQFDSTDKYSKKRRIYWSKPCIFISNDNPFEDDSRGRRIDKEWLAANTLCVNIATPLGRFVNDNQ
jgi:hypothetical protein